MNELERFFRQIVRNLTATDPARLRQPLPVADIRDSIVPYRTNRRALELESSEDYELVLMQLCAGEGGFFRTDPEEVRAELEAEVRSSNPDLELLHRYENAVVHLESEPLAWALDPKPELAFAPPAHSDQRGKGEERITRESWPDEPYNAPHPERPENDRDIARCSQCQGVLPAGRIINFCPHCGQSQVLTTCPVCQGELEAGWRHCVSCGFRIGG
ncbi:MAG: zinc ribbon domain-containing protein [Gemmatimonadales bacterium]